MPHVAASSAGPSTNLAVNEPKKGGKKEKGDSKWRLEALRRPPGSLDAER